MQAAVFGGWWLEGQLTGGWCGRYVDQRRLVPFVLYVKEMRRKRLQHQADTFCQMFCGWRLCNSHEELTVRRSGSLHIDILAGTATHNGTVLQDLNIAGELSAWFQGDLRDNNIPVEQVRSATLDAEVTITDLSGPRRSPERWNTKIRRYLSCDIQCRSRIETDETSYESEMVDHEEWPDGWWNEHRTT
jgi:hypothetical protein